MSSSSTSQLRSIFDRALDCETTNARNGFLDDACGSNRPLRVRVDRLLDAYFDANSFLESPVRNLPMTGQSSHNEKAGSSIGPYLLQERIGAGGFGVVYRAEQREPVRREVALKLIKPGMDTREVMSRFNTERQALAMMNHPSIATCLDVGATENGRPFFVMELVDGVPISEYCDNQQLSISTRLELFVQVCNAVQHAHQKGVIHRDLKPTNILVADKEGIASPKIIDFGIAKAMDQDLSENPVRTRNDQLVGTPLYMSPEQAASSNRDIDARSDIYSLEILLYELLTGTTPITQGDLREAGFEEILRRIQEQEAARPSSRLAESEEILAVAAKDRQSDPSRLTSLIRGDLDWIVMKALDKKRERRYDSPSAMGRDIERYLSNDPVDARPPSKFYRVGKFVRKNRVAVSTGIAFAVVLIAATIISSWQAWRATQNESIAVDALEAEEESARRTRVALKSESQKRRAFESMWSFLVEMLTSPDPLKEGRRITVVEMLDRNRLGLDDKFAADPLTRASLMLVIGDTYSALGMMEKATDLLQRSLEQHRQILGARDRDTRNCMHSLATHLARTGELDRAYQLARQLVEFDNQDFQDHEHSIRAKTLLAHHLYLRYQFEDAIALLVPAVESATAELGADADLTSIALALLATNQEALGNVHDALVSRKALASKTSELDGEPGVLALHRKAQLAKSLLMASRIEEAAALAEEVLELANNTFEKDDPALVDFLFLSGWVKGETGGFRQAIERYESALAIRNTIFPDDHFESLSLKRNIAFMYGKAEQYETAIGILEEVYPKAVENLGESDPLSISIAHHMGNMYRMVGKQEETVPILERVVGLAKEKLGEDDPETIQYMGSLANAYELVGRKGEATLIYDRVLELHTKMFGAGHHHTLLAMDNLGRLRVATGDIESGTRLLEESFKGLQAVRGDHHPVVWQAGYDLGAAYVASNQLTDAVSTLKWVLDQRTQKLGADHPHSVNLANELATIQHVMSDEALDSGSGIDDAATMRPVRARHYMRTGEFEKARIIFEELVSENARENDAEHPLKISHLANLAACELELKQFELAIRHSEQVHEMLLQILGPDHPEVNLEQGNLASVYLQAGEVELARKTMAEFIDGSRKRLKDELALAGLLAMVGRDLVDYQQFDHAVLYFEECLQVRIDFKEQEWLTANTMSALGEAILENSKSNSDDGEASQQMKRAEKLLLEGFERLDAVRQTIPDQVRNERLVESCNRLVALYKLKGNQQEMEKWISKAKGLSNSVSR